MNRRRANDSRAFDGSRDRAPVVAAVLPAYRTASSIRSVIEQIPPDICHVIVVDDAGRADFAKGNRFADLSVISAMPPLRRAGNLVLSFLVKAASGYWSLFDPCKGYLAVTSDLLKNIRRDRLADRYFFEISLLCESYRASGVVVDIDMHPRYGDEISSLSPIRSLFEFSGRLLGRMVGRIGFAYFLRDFTVVSVFITAGVPMLVFGTLWSAYHWYRSVATQVVASTGTVMIGTLAIILAFQLLLQAVVLDVQSEPGRQKR